MTLGPRCLLLLLILSGLAGCSLTRDLKAVPTTLVLELPAEPAPAGSATNRRWQLQIEAVQADPLRGGARVLRRSGASLGAYAGIAWSEPAADLWQRLLVTGLAAAVPGVARAGAPLHSDCRLLIELQAFEIDADAAPPTAHIALALALVGSADGRLLAQQPFAARAPVGGHGATAVGTAFQAALAGIWNVTRPWVLAQGDRACGTARPGPARPPQPGRSAPRG